MKTEIPVNPTEKGGRPELTVRPPSQIAKSHSTDQLASLFSFFDFYFICNHFPQ